MTLSCCDATVVAIALEAGADAVICPTLADLGAISATVTGGRTASLGGGTAVTTDAQDVPLQRQLQTIGPFDEQVGGLSKRADFYLSAMHLLLFQAFPQVSLCPSMT